MTSIVKSHNEKMMDLLKDELNVVVKYSDERKPVYNDKSFLSVNPPKKMLTLKSKRY